MRNCQRRKRRRQRSARAIDLQNATGANGSPQAQRLARQISRVLQNAERQTGCTPHTTYAQNRKKPPANAHLADDLRDEKPRRKSDLEVLGAFEAVRGRALEGGLPGDRARERVLRVSVFWKTGRNSTPRRPPATRPAQRAPRNHAGARAIEDSPVFPTSAGFHDLRVGWCVRRRRVVHRRPETDRNRHDCL